MSKAATVCPLKGTNFTATVGGDDPFRDDDDVDEDSEEEEEVSPPDDADSEVSRGDVEEDS